MRKSVQSISQGIGGFCTNRSLSVLAKVRYISYYCTSYSLIHWDYHSFFALVVVGLQVAKIIFSQNQSKVHIEVPIYLSGASVASLGDLPYPVGHHRRQRHRRREPYRRRRLVRRVGQRERPDLPSGLVRCDPNLGEQLLDVDAGVDEEVAGGEGDDGERDGGGQVGAAVLGQEVLGLVGPRPGLLPLFAFLASLLFLGAEYFPEADLEAVLLGDLLGRLGLLLLSFFDGGEPPARVKPESPRGEEAGRELRTPGLQQPVVVTVEVSDPGRGEVGEEDCNWN